MKTVNVDELIAGNKDREHLRLTAGHNEAFDANGCLRFQLFIERGGGPALELYDGNGTPRLHAGLSGNGSPSLTLRDGNHTSRLELELGEDAGDPEFTLYDKSGAHACVLGPDWKRAIELRIVDKDGKLVP